VPMSAASTGLATGARRHPNQRASPRRIAADLPRRKRLAGSVGRAAPGPGSEVRGQRPPVHGPQGTRTPTASPHPEGWRRRGAPTTIAPRSAR
jgi:hypothetical protein